MSAVLIVQKYPPYAGELLSDYLLRLKINRQQATKYALIIHGAKLTGGRGSKFYYDGKDEQLDDLIGDKYLRGTIKKNMELEKIIIENPPENGESLYVYESRINNNRKNGDRFMLVALTLKNHVYISIIADTFVYQKQIYEVLNYDIPVNVLDILE